MQSTESRTYVRCWYVRCKTENCCLLFLKRIGSVNRSLHTLQPRIKPFRIACPECSIEHVYGQADLEECNWPNPPSGYCKEFRDAQY